jgi:hypothetical protein
VAYKIYGFHSVCLKYFVWYCSSNVGVLDARTPEQSGFGWTMETLKTPGESHKMFKMNVKLFYKLHDLLVSSYGLELTLHMPSYPMDKQKMIVAATMCLHNFICENHANDKDFRKYDQNPDYVPTIPSRYRRHHVTQNAGDTSTSKSDDRTMDKF